MAKQVGTPSPLDDVGRGIIGQAAGRVNRRGVCPLPIW